MAGRVGHAYVEHHHLGVALVLGLHDPLGVRVEVVAGLQVRGEQQDHLGVRVVRRRAVVAAPGGVAQSGTRRADVGVAVVAVDAPRQQEALGEPVLAGPTDVVDHAVATVGLDRGADPGRDIVERLVPGAPLPPTGAALADPPERVQDPLGVVDLVDGRRALGAVAAARPRVRRVALHLGDGQVVLGHVGEQPARGLAVEAGGGDQHELARHLARMRLARRSRRGGPRSRAAGSSRRCSCERAPGRSGAVGRRQRPGRPGGPRLRSSSPFGASRQRYVLGGADVDGLVGEQRGLDQDPGGEHGPAVVAAPRRRRPAGPPPRSG